VTTIEPVSGAGRSGLDELWNQTRALFNQTPTDPEFFPEQIAFNVLSQVDVMRDDGVTAYEQRVSEELQALKVSQSQISVTALRVPVMYGCGVSLTFETTKELSVENICKNLSISPRFVVDQAAEQPPSTMSVIGDDRIHIGRIRIKALEGNKGSSVSCWLVADNIRACIARPIVDLYRSLMPVE
jgi:aspartate-semialdehyde dehydrogenase